MSFQKLESKVRLNDFDASIGLDRGASKAKEICWYLIKCVFFLSPLPYPKSFKKFLLKLFGASVGKNVGYQTSRQYSFPLETDHWGLCMDR